MKNIILVLFSLVILSSCGGGGVTYTPTNLAENTTDIIQKNTKDLLEIADEIEVTYSSVVISARSNVIGISSDFDGDEAKIVIKRQGKSDITLDTDNTVPGSEYYPEANFAGLTNREGKYLILFNSNTNSATAAQVGLNWDSDESSDYLAGGNWIHVETTQETERHIEFGTFYSGSEIDHSNPPNLPTSGTASYKGNTGGLYTTVYGSDDPAFPQDSIDAGEFYGTVNLAANFGTNTISGSAVIDGHDSFFNNTIVSNPRVRFSSTQIKGNGTFEGRSDISFTNLPPSLQISSSSGKWAGQFSNRPDNNGDPRLVGGSFSGLYETTGGTQSLYFGILFAGK